MLKCPWKRARTSPERDFILPLEHRDGLGSSPYIHDGFLTIKFLFVFYFLKFIFILLFRATLTAYGGSQARGRIRATAASLHHSHSHAKSKPYLQPTPQLMATLAP